MVSLYIDSWSLSDYLDKINGSPNVTALVRFNRIIERKEQ